MLTAIKEHPDSRFILNDPESEVITKLPTENLAKLMDGSAGCEGKLIFSINVHPCRWHGFASGVNMLPAGTVHRQLASGRAFMEAKGNKTKEEIDAHYQQYLPEADAQSQNSLLAAVEEAFPGTVAWGSGHCVITFIPPPCTADEIKAVIQKKLTVIDPSITSGVTFDVLEGAYFVCLREHGAKLLASLSRVHDTGANLAYTTMQLVERGLARTGKDANDGRVPYTLYCVDGYEKFENRTLNMYQRDFIAHCSREALKFMQTEGATQDELDAEALRHAETIRQTSERGIFASIQDAFPNVDSIGGDTATAAFLINKNVKCEDIQAVVDKKLAELGDVASGVKAIVVEGLWHWRITSTLTRLKDAPKQEG